MAGNDVRKLKHGRKGDDGNAVIYRPGHDARGKHQVLMPRVRQWLLMVVLRSYLEMATILLASLLALLRSAFERWLSSVELQWPFFGGTWSRQQFYGY